MNDEETRPLHEPTTPLTREETAMTESPETDSGTGTGRAPDTWALPEDTHGPTHGATTRDPGRHDVRPVALVLGVLYLGVVAAWALAQSAVLGVEDLGLVVPVMLLVAGLAGLAGLATRRRGPTDGTLGR